MYRKWLPGSTYQYSHNPKYHGIWEHLKRPCGQCTGCRLERSRQWAIRCLHEASLYENNCFITLTYNDQNLPEDRSLDVNHFQLFMKRLRKKYGAKIRFYHCGEYGEQYGRPHYHACIFNHDFSDKQLWKTQNGVPLYTSADLNLLWPYGFTSIGSVTYESAAYVARYILKKITGQNADDHYMWIDPASGQVHQRKPEYTTMSRRPGIARGWFDKYRTDVYPHDRVIINELQVKPPKYYDKLFEQHSPELMEFVKYQREEKQKLAVDNNTKDRLAVREEILLERLTRLPRTLT